MAGSVPKTIGELSLSKLLSSLEAVLDPDVYVYITLPPKSMPPADLAIQMLFQEREGLTVISTKASAIQYGLSYTFPCRMITLDVHSSLEAVGFIAVIATELKKLAIGVNPVSAYHHDFLFIPDGREIEVMAMLKEIKQRAKSESGPLLPPL